MALNKTERRVLAKVIERLHGRNADTRVSEALTGPCKLYLETWVIPALETLADEDRTADDLRFIDRMSR
jgi:hypothetical protein